MINRRHLLKNAGLLSILSPAPSVKSFAEDNLKKGVLRFAHLTDIYLEPELNAPAGLAKCLHHLQSQKKQPSFILSGGDSIFDALHHPKDRVEL